MKHLRVTYDGERERIWSDLCRSHSPSDRWPRALKSYVLYTWFARGVVSIMFTKFSCISVFLNLICRVYASGVNDFEGGMGRLLKCSAKKDKCKRLHDCLSVVCINVPQRYGSLCDVS